MTIKVINQSVIQTNWSWIIIITNSFSQDRWQKIIVCCNINNPNQLAQYVELKTRIPGCSVDQRRPWKGLAPSCLSAVLCVNTFIFWTERTVVLLDECCRERVNSCVCERRSLTVNLVRSVMGKANYCCFNYCHSLVFAVVKPHLKSIQAASFSSCF